jgi:hypothetical protein
MALLEQLRPDIGTLPYEEAFVIFTEYFYKREVDLKTITSFIKSKKKLTTSTAKRSVKDKKEKKGKGLKLTAVQLAALKKLGLV